MYGEREELLDPCEWLVLDTGMENLELTVPQELMSDRVIGQAWSHQTLPDGPCGTVPVLTGSALPALLKSPAQLRASGCAQPWTSQLIPGTVTGPPWQALEVVVLWVPHGPTEPAQV